MPSRLNILVVEDDAQALGYICALVASWGFSCTPTRSAAEALASTERQCPDVVISDLIMPGMDGLELLKELRFGRERCAGCGRAQCPIFFILISGFDSVSSAVRAVMQGADEVIVKPLKEEELLVMLQRVDAERKPEFGSN